VGELAGRHLKKVSLELGGKNSLIVLDDADLELAVSNAAWGAYLHQGQICMASGRILVHRKLEKDFVSRLAQKAKNLPVGDPRRAMWPSGRSSIAASSITWPAWCTTPCRRGQIGSGRHSEALFYRATVLSGVKPGMRAFEEEIFGPVASVTGFDDEAEAIALANRTEYGLSAGIISASVARASGVGERLRTGILHINNQTVDDDVINPFGGVGASGNGTSIGGPANWEEFTQWQWMTIRSAAPAYPM